MIRRLPVAMMIAASLALAACGSPSLPDDAEADANGTDPALAAALQSQIMVDPSLQQQANADSVRPPAQPYSGAVPNPAIAANDSGTGDLLRAPDPVPAGKDCAQCAASREAVTLGGLAARQKDGRTSGCAAQLRYSASWAARLPADLPLHPQARVTEAAGTEGGACALRVVSFTVPAPMQSVIDWYYTKAVRGGYTAEHQLDGQEHILGGTRDRDQGAYVVFATPRADGGVDVDFVANNGA